MDELTIVRDLNFGDLILRISKATGFPLSAEHMSKLVKARIPNKDIDVDKHVANILELAAANGYIKKEKDGYIAHKDEELVHTVVEHNPLLNSQFGEADDFDDLEDESADDCPFSSDDSDDDEDNDANLPRKITLRSNLRPRRKSPTAAVRPSRQRRGPPVTQTFNPTIRTPSPLNKQSGLRMKPKRTCKQKKRVKMNPLLPSMVDVDGNYNDCYGYRQGRRSVLDGALREENGRPMAYANQFEVSEPIDVTTTVEKSGPSAPKPTTEGHVNSNVSQPQGASGATAPSAENSTDPKSPRQRSQKRKRSKSQRRALSKRRRRMQSPATAGLAGNRATGAAAAAPEPANAVSRGKQHKH